MSLQCHSTSRRCGNLTMTGCSDNCGWAQRRTSSASGDPRCSPNKSVSPGWSLFSLAPASYWAPSKSVLTCSALHWAREQHYPKAPSAHWDLQPPASSLSQRHPVHLFMLYLESHQASFLTEQTRQCLWTLDKKETVDCWKTIGEPVFQGI